MQEKPHMQNTMRDQAYLSEDANSGTVIIAFITQIPIHTTLCLRECGIVFDIWKSFTNIFDSGCQQKQS